MKGIIFSGMRPTGKLHLGNYFGALSNWIKLQDEYKCYYGVVDWHALTTGYDCTEMMKENTIEMVIDWLSAGIDPNKSTLLIQSYIPELAELHLLLSMITPLSWLERNPVVKEQVRDLVLKEKMSSLKNMVFLMIHLYQCIFTIPEIKLSPTPKILGTDGRKMSKSLNNYISLSDQPEVIRTKIMSMITDPEKIKLSDPGHPEICTVFDYHRKFNIREVPDIEKKCSNAQLGCVACKERLSEILIEFFQGFRERREGYEKNKDMVWDMLKSGSQEAREVAKTTLYEVKKSMKIDFEGY